MQKRHSSPCDSIYDFSARHAEPLVKHIIQCRRNICRRIPALIYHDADHVEFHVFHNIFCLPQILHIPQAKTNLS